MVRICPVWKWFSVECRMCPLVDSPPAYQHKLRTGVFIVHSTLSFSRNGFFIATPPLHSVIWGWQKGVCAVGVCVPAVCAGENQQPTCALGPRANVCMMCVCVWVCECMCATQGAPWCCTPVNVKHWPALLNVYTTSVCRALMEEQCSVHSTHWGTLKLTVISSKIHCTDTHIKCCQGGAGA